MISLSHKCKICGEVPVNEQGDICQGCSDPYSSHYADPPPLHGTGNRRRVLIGDAVVPADISVACDNDRTGTSVILTTAQNTYQPVVQSTTAPANPRSAAISSPINPVVSNSALRATDYETEGVVRNYKEETSKSFLLERWVRTLFKGVPFSMDNTIHTFQVYPQGWMTTNTGIPICDEVVVYGQVNRGKISLDNTVQVWGKRDTSNAIVATKIFNVASGTWLNIRYGLSPLAAWIITLAVVSLPFLLFFYIQNSPEALIVLLGIILMLIAIFNFKLFIKIIGLALMGVLAVTTGLIKMTFGIFGKNR